MIAHFNKNNNTFEEKNNKVKKCMENIEEIYNFSPLLEVISVEYTENTQSFEFLNILLDYETTLSVNDYSSFICPNCKKKCVLHYHKTYTRNIVFAIGNYIITAKITLIVLECNHCKQLKNTQHYHALIPSAIFPYHSYSKGIIFNCLNDKIVNNTKIKDIENKYKISYQLLYYWLVIMHKYLAVASIILKIPFETINIIKGIITNDNKFLKQFYQQYFHPFFLFKLTCVPLAITP